MTASLERRPGSLTLGLVALGRQKGWTDESVLARMEAIDDEMVATGSSSTTVVRTDDFLLLRYPDDLRSPTMGQAQAWVLSSSPFSWFEEEAAAHVRGWGIDEVWWWVDHAAPEATVAAIAARTGDPVDDVQLPGLPLEKHIISSALPRVE